MSNILSDGVKRSIAFSCTAHNYYNKMSRRRILIFITPYSLSFDLPTAGMLQLTVRIVHVVEQR
jgi:hypothetical protein